VPDLPEFFDPKLGPAIQLFRMPAAQNADIPPILDDKIMVKAWADVNKYLLSQNLFAAIMDVMHGATEIKLNNGTILRSMMSSGPQDVTDPETGWVSTIGIFQVLCFTQVPSIADFVDDSQTVKQYIDAAIAAEEAAEDWGSF
jgi:hypothetical protein